MRRRRRATSGTPPDDAPATPTAPTPRISTGTTSFAVADADGNMIAVTQTLSTWGGTFYVSKGLGLPLQQSPAIEPPDGRARTAAWCR